MIILLGFWFGVKGLIQHEQFGWVIEYGRSVVAGMWVTIGAPFLFRRGLNLFFGRCVKESDRNSNLNEEGDKEDIIKHVQKISEEGEFLSLDEAEKA